MKQKLILLLLMVTLVNVAIGQKSELNKAQAYLEVRKEVRFEFEIEDKADLNFLTKTISIDRVDNNKIQAYANKNEFEEFLKLNYNFNVIAPAGANAKVISMANTVAEMANWDHYPTYEVYLEMMSNFATDYPNLCQLDTIGYSNEGRLLIAVKISDNVAVEESEPEFFYTSTMHGDETTGFVLMLRLIDYLLSNYGSLPEITDLVDNIQIYINPDANPDGTYNGGNHTVADATRGNSNGTDINRDFPDPRIGANSPYATETQAMMDYADERNFVMAANFHGGIELVNYPWDTWTEGSPDNHPHADRDWWFKISTDYATSCQNNSPSGYMTGENNGVTNGGDWYVITGGRQDYMNWYHRCREVTVEVSNTKLLSSDALPAHWNYNYEALLNYMKEVLYGFKGTVTNTDGDPLYANITIASHDEDNSDVFSNSLHGDYYRPIEPGTYDVTYSSYGYISQTHTVTVSGYETSVVQDVVLTSASSVSLSGTVVDGTTGDPIEGVSVELVDVPLDPATTNTNGQYSFTNILEDTYEFRVSHPDYATAIETHTVTSSNNVIDFVIYPSQAISFEDGTIPEDFTQGGDADWVIDNTVAYHGTYSLKSGNISHDQTSEITLSFEANNDGIVSFFKKVSSESGWDFLKFYIDGAEQGEWSGEVDWSEETYNITAGSHTLKWVYEKDGSESNGSDCGWIDYIVLPPTQVANPILSVNTTEISVQLFEGESTEETFSVSNIGEGTLSYTIEIEDAASNSWLTVSQNSGTLGSSESDEIGATIDATDLTEGIYTTNINISDGTKIIKTIEVTADVDDLSIEKLSNDNISIFPNPFNDKLKILVHSASNQKMHITFFNLLGEKVLTKSCQIFEGSNSIEVDTENLGSGYYLYKIESKRSSIQGKIIKE